MSRPKTICCKALLILACLGRLPAAYDADALVDSMRLNNLGIANSRIALEQAELDVKMAKADFFPKITYGATAAYIANPLERQRLSAEELAGLFDWPGGVSAAASGEYVTLYDGMDNSHYSFSLGFAQPVSTWGKLSKRLDITNEMKSVSADRLALEQTQLEARIRANCEVLGLADEMSAIYGASEIDARELSSMVEDVKSSGMGVDRDVLEARSSVMAFRYAVAQCEAARGDAVRDLAILSGIDGLSDQDIVRSPFSREKARALLAEMDEFSMVSRATAPDKEAMRIAGGMEAIARDRQYVSRASALYAPDIVLVGNLSYSGSRFPFIESGWYTQDRWNAVVALKLSGNLFDGGSQFERISRNNLQVKAEENNKRRTADSIARSVKALRSQLAASLSSADYRQALLDEKAESLRLAREGLESGSASRLEYLKAALEKAKAEGDLLSDCIRISELYWSLSALL